MKKRKPRQNSSAVHTPATNNTGNTFIPHGLTLDAYSNPMARLGFGQPNHTEATEYPLTRLTRNYHLMVSLYRSHWIPRRIIDIIPEDMCKNWYTVTSQLPPDDMVRLARLERQTQIRRHLLEGLRWGRLYGGAAGVMMIEGHEDILDTPLDYDTIMPGSFCGLLIVDRWSGIFPSGQLVTDVRDNDFGTPEWYDVRIDGITQTRVHHSRVVRFMGRDLPYWEKQSEMYWGASEMEHVYEELRKRDNTSANIAQLVFQANLRIYKSDQMDHVLAMGNKRGLEELERTLQAQNILMNNQGLLVIGPNDSFENYQYTFGGLDKIYEQFMLDVSGAAEIPVTKLFGRSPAGLNATGESDMQNYYDSIEEKQEAYLRPVIDKVLPIMCMSEFGAIPDDLDYRFNPCRRPTEKERADLVKQRTESVVGVFNTGLISQRTALKELRQISDLTGAWSNITDDDIEKADDIIAPIQSEVDLTSELPGVYGLMNQGEPI